MQLCRSNRWQATGKTVSQFNVFPSTALIMARFFFVSFFLYYGFTFECCIELYLGVGPLFSM